MKEERNHLIEKANVYKMEKEKYEKTIIEKEVAMEAMRWSVVDLGRTLNCLETEKRLLLNRNEALASYLRQTPASGSQTTFRRVKHIPPFVPKISVYCSVSNSEILQQEGFLVKTVYFGADKKPEAQKWGSGGSKNSPRRCHNVCQFDSVFKMPFVYAVYAPSPQC